VDDGFSCRENVAREFGIPLGRSSEFVAFAALVNFGSRANFTCPIGHFMTEHTGVTEVRHSVLTWENETTIVLTTPWIEPIALETAAYSDGAR